MAQKSNMHDMFNTKNTLSDSKQNSKTLKTDIIEKTKKSDETKPAINKVDLADVDKGLSATTFNSNGIAKRNNKTKYDTENNTKKNSAKRNPSKNETNREATTVSSPKAGEDDGVAKNNIIKSIPPDTVVIRDTVFIYDTLSIKDTVVIVDTVRVNDANNVELNNAKLKFDLQLFTGLSYGAQTLSQSTSSGADYFTQENPLFTPSFGFNINASWNNINLGTGVEYNILNSYLFFRFLLNEYKVISNR